MMEKDTLKISQSTAAVGGKDRTAVASSKNDAMNTVALASCVMGKYFLLGAGIVNGNLIFCDSSDSVKDTA